MTQEKFDLSKALQLMKEGYKVSRLSAANKNEYMRINDNFVVVACDGISKVEKPLDGLFIEAILATDWIIHKKNK